MLDVHHDVIRCPKHWEIVQRSFQKLRGGHALMLSAVAEERNRSAAAAVLLRVPLARFPVSPKVLFEAVTTSYF